MAYWNGLRSEISKELEDLKFTILLNCVNITAGLNPGCREKDRASLSCLILFERFKRHFIFAGDLWLLIADDRQDHLVPIIFVVLALARFKVLLLSII